MKLQHDQVLLLHSIVFHYLTSNDSAQFRDEAEDMLHDLKDSLLSSNENANFSDDDEHEDEDYDDEEEDHDQWSHVEDSVCVDVLTGLPKLTAGYLNVPEKGNLIFFGNCPTSFDLEGKNGVIESGDDIRVVTRRSKELVLASDDETWIFKVSKFPREWTALLEVNKPYLIE